jgi:2-polyprenyl-3-methyl-5-hydroxy-6-metoxy-1,4-benzoquinol methylase
MQTIQKPAPRKTAGAIDTDRLNALVGLAINDLGAAVNGALVLLGDRLGIFKSLAEGPATSQQLADRSGLNERYLREWLSAQAASGYVEYDPRSDAFSMSPEQVAVFADPDSPVAMTGGVYSVASVYHDEPLLEAAFRTGEGVAWGDHHNCLFCGTERFFRPGYAANLTTHWIPALDGVEAKLKAGARVADIGCGHGASTLIMARAFPDSRFHGYDIHPASIETARKHADEQGLANISFDVATAQDFPGKGYDLVTTFDALHDMGDPVGAATHARRALADDGTWMIVEPMAGDSLAENLNPVGRIYYGFSTMICTPAAMSQKVGLALGAQAGQRRLGGVISEGGFTRFRRATETPVNMILEARP